MKKILILSANPINTDRLRLDEEVREIQAGLKLSKYGEQFQIIPWWAVRVDDLRRALLETEPQIVHFSGHGAGTQGLALENNAGQMQLVSTESLAGLFKLHQRTVECILLNACYSEEQAQAIHQHINCVIGMNNTIRDTAALSFAKAFYEALGSGKSYEEAYQHGRNNIDLNSIPDSSVPIINSRNSLISSVDINSPKQDKKPENQETQPRSNPAPSLNISGGSLSGVNIGQNVGGNLNQSLNYSPVETEKQLTLAEVIKLLTQIETLLKNSDLPSEAREKALKHLDTVKEEVQATEPDKDFAAKSLQRAIQILKQTNEVFGVGMGIWEKLKPIVSTLATWLGISVNSIL
jgi:CHAT domain